MYNLFYSALGERVLIKNRSSLPAEGIDSYHTLRLQCGVPEGTQEMPPGHCLPLEMNIDYMNGGKYTI